MDINAANKKEVIKALLKKAVGYTQSECVEEYTTNADQIMTLSKKKVTKKHIPPDVSALKVLFTFNDIGQDKDITKMTDEELESEKIRLLNLLKDFEQKGTEDALQNKDMENDNEN